MCNRDYCITVCYNKTITLEVPEDYDEIDLDYCARTQVSKMLGFMHSDGWSEDEFEVTRDYYGK